MIFKLLLGKGKEAEFQPPLIKCLLQRFSSASFVPLSEGHFTEVLRTAAITVWRGIFMIMFILEFLLKPKTKKNNDQYNFKVKK
jgi:hypothetical protein